MAYIMKRKFPNKISFLAQVKHKEFKTTTKSFGTKTLAQMWARAIERKHDIGDYSDYSEASKLTFGDLLIRYWVENKHRAKKDWKNEGYKIDIILKDTIADTNCLCLSSKHLSEFRERLLMSVTGSTFNKYLSFMSTVIQTAINDWGIYFPSNPCRSMKREKEPSPRTRVLEKFWMLNNKWEERVIFWLAFSFRIHYGFTSLIKLWIIYSGTLIFLELQLSS